MPGQALQDCVVFSACFPVPALLEAVMVLAMLVGVHL